MLNYIAVHSDWIVPFVPFLCVLVWFAIESRWEAYSRRKNYQELKILNELREKSIITQEEFAQWQRKETLRKAVIKVDDFPQDFGRTALVDADATRPFVRAA